MQTKHLELYEVIYEITGECHNNCAYCGSKEIWKKKTDEDQIKKIVEAIGQFPPREIDISGGDPLVVSLDTHKFLVEHLKSKGLKAVKILVNPMSLRKDPKAAMDILGLYDWCGVSVNTEEELDIWTQLYVDDSLFRSFKHTVITNFNLGNVFLFPVIEKFVKKHDLMWQIQYTMYSDPDHPLAIYNNLHACEALGKWIAQARQKGKIKLMLADNMNCGLCGAGKHSLGILANGDVVPCLSMRSWIKDINKIVQGNILTQPLEELWQFGFKDQRFKDFFCCKDHCKNRCIQEQTVFTEVDDGGTSPIEVPDGWKYPTILPKGTGSGIIVYGVGVDQNKTYIYGVKGDYGTNVDLYGVSTPDKCSSNLEAIEDIFDEGIRNSKDDGDLGVI